MVNSAAPQLIIISRPSGSATASRRSTSACRLIRGPPSAANRHGWVLCTEGAQTALDTTYLTISSAAIGLLMIPADRDASGKGRCQGPEAAGPSAPAGPRRAVLPRLLGRLGAAPASARGVPPTAGSVARRPRTGAGRSA